MADSREMVFAESCLPLLQSGEYELTAWEDGKELGKSQVMSEKINVAGPRFTLGADEVIGVSPAEGMKGSYETVLPQISLKRKTLPWERSIQPSGVTAVRKDNKIKKENPWLYVFLLAGDEIVSPQTGTAKEVIQPPEGTFFPNLKLEEGEGSQTVSYIDVDAGIFSDIFPHKDELCYLAHARKKTEDAGNTVAVRKAKETEDWYSVVLGNRLPRESEQGIQNHAYLVSVEGFETWWEKDPGSYGKVRLIVLYDWKFISVSERYHWKEIMGDLNVGWLKMEGDSNCGEDLKELLAHGYVPLPHYLRDGSRTVSFYRGPFVPLRLKQKEYSVYDSDALYRYDPNYGVFDVSLSCAWQHGRLLALGNPSFVSLLLKKKGTMRKLRGKILEREMISNHLGQVSGEEPLEVQMLKRLNGLWEDEE